MWLNALRRRLGLSRSNKPARGCVRPASSGSRLQIENLEDRTMPTVFKVTSLLDNLNPVITSGYKGTAASPYLAPSLRSAIAAANATPGGNTIELALPGTYQVSIPPSGADDNTTGDLDIMPGGGNLTIENTSGGTVAVSGNGLDRVFNINPNPVATTAPFTVTLDGFTVENGFTSGSGGGIEDSGNASLTLNNMTIKNNTAHNGGGVAFTNAVSALWTFTVNSSTIANNQASNNGGGIETEGLGTIDLNAGTVVTGNTAPGNGGGIWLQDIDGVTGVTVTDTSAISLTTPPAVTFKSADAYGNGAAGTAVLNADGMVAGVQVTNPGSGYDKPPIVSFTPSVAGLSAVATIAYLESANLNLTGATVSNNFAGGSGGGIGNAGVGAVTITNSTVENNSAYQSGGGYTDVNNVDTLTVMNSLFEGNVSEYAGGGIFVNGPNAVIENSTFKANHSNYGGGFDSASPLTLSGDLFAQNTAVIQGGGFEAHGPSLTGTDLEFIDNTTGAFGNGGGIFFVGQTLTLSDSTFSGNTSSLNGGGLDFEGSGTGALQSTITNSTFTGNTALDNTGGGISVPGGTGTLVLINDTIDGNVATGNGGGLYWGGTSPSVVELENTIIAGNSSPTGSDLSVLSGPITDLGGNVIGTPTESELTAKSDQLNVNPLLGSLANNGGPTVGSTGNTMPLETQALLTGSPAIGKGVETLTPPFTDERGDLRPNFLTSDTLDVGAFDSNGVAPATHSTVPKNGDTNPYGVAFVPSNFPSGVFKPGELLVTNFNNAAGTQGLGTTLVEINAAGAATPIFTSKQPGLDAALGFLKAGFVLVGNVPNVNGTPQTGSIQILNAKGQLVGTLTNSTFLDGPWYLTVANDTGGTAQVFVSNVLNGTVTRLNLSIKGTAISVTSMTEIASGYGHLVSPTAFTVGPAGLAFDAATGVLYVASSADDAVYAIANAATTTTNGGTGALVTSGSFLHGPLGLVIAPNGNLLIANSDSVNANPDDPSELTEITTNGVYVGQLPIDPNDGGAFGLGYQITNGKLEFAAVDDNTNSIFTWEA